MRSILITALATGAFAFPSIFSRQGPPSGPPSCMTLPQAQKVAQNFAALIGKPFNTALATAALATDFHDYSDSVIELINAGCAGPIPLGSATFTNRSNFIAAQSHQQPIPFQILKVWHDCRASILRWTSSPGPGFVQPEQEITGIIVLETIPNPSHSSSQPWQIETVYSEFNSGAWLVDIGNFTPVCSASKRDLNAGRSINLLNTGRGPMM